jgi:hypothetical protein
MGHFRDEHKQPIPVKVNHSGYIYIKTRNGYVAAHRLVMKTWRPTEDMDNLTVDHLDHNKRNNSLDNLEWVSEKENLRRAKADLIVSVEGDPEMVKKVDVSVVANRSPRSNYNYYLKLSGGVILSVEEFALLQWNFIGRNIICPRTKQKCAHTGEFCEAINYKASAIKSWDGKLFGYQCELIKK